MTGIQYVTDEKGRKVAVQIDLAKHGELWQDVQDVLISRSRRHEKQNSARQGESKTHQKRQAFTCIAIVSRWHLAPRRNCIVCHGKRFPES